MGRIILENVSMFDTQNDCESGVTVAERCERTTTQESPYSEVDVRMVSW